MAHTMVPQSAAQRGMLLTNPTVARIAGPIELISVSTIHFAIDEHDALPVSADGAMRSARTARNPDDLVALLTPVWEDLEHSSKPFAPFARDIIRTKLVDALAANGRIVDIERILAIPVSSSLNGARLHLAVAKAYLGQRKDVQARDALHRALSVIASYEKLDAPPRGVSELAWRSLLSKFRQEALMTLSFIEELSGNPDAARSLFGLVLDHYDSPDVHWARGQFLESTGAEGAAEEYAYALSEAFADVPAFLDAINRVAVSKAPEIIESARRMRPVLLRDLLLRQLSDDRLTPFTVERMNGRVASSQKVIDHDKVSLLVFFETECGPCVDEHNKLFPELLASYPAALDINVIGLETQGTLQKFIDAAGHHDIDYFVSPGEGLRTAFGVQGVPLLFVIKDDKVVFRTVGYGPTMGERLKMQIDVLLNSSAPISAAPHRAIR